MISLGDWFHCHAKRPLYFVTLVVGLGTLAGLWKLHSDQRAYQSRTLKQVAESVGLALSQKNRTLLESILESTHWSLGSQSAILKEEGSPLVSSENPRARGIFFRDEVILVPGFGNYQVVLALPSHLVSAGYAGVVLTSILVLLSCWLILVRVERRIRSDILHFMETGLSSDVPAEIVEIEKIRQSQAEGSRMRVELAVASAIMARSKQIAHDIRSPLSALTVLAGQSSRLQEDERTLLRRAVNRICDMVNKLSEQAQVSKPGRESPIKPLAPPLQIHPISTIVEDAVCEARIQHKTGMDIEISADLSEGYGAFARIEPLEFRRVLSNLINNSVEAIHGAGTVTAFLRVHQTKIEVAIVDTGVGISPERLSLIGMTGATFGKRGGSGLGLSHAKNTVESWGGKIDIRSEETKGTQVVVELPRGPVPGWFLPHLSMGDVENIVILDDDPSIHQVWRHRLEAGKKDSRLVHLSSALEFREWFLKEKAGQCFLMLADFELERGDSTGLDLMEEFKLGSRGVLVTSHYEDQRLQARLSRSGVRLLPKGWVPVVPIVS